MKILIFPETAIKQTNVFIKVDCGLGRLGVQVEEAEDFIKKIIALPNIFIEGIYTHLPFKNAAGLAWVQPKLRLFEQLLARLKSVGIDPPVTQSIASSGIVCGVKTACNSDCPGHLLYGGLSRVTPDLGDLSGFDPVLKAVKSKLIHIECHSNDKTIGVGGCQSLKSGSITGVGPIGLHDGYRPAIPGQTAEMLIREQRVPVLSVSQECTVLDITAIHDPQLGEEVIVLGESGNGNIAIEEMPQWFGGIPLDVLMMFNERLPYRYLGDLFS